MMPVSSPIHFFLPQRHLCHPQPSSVILNTVKDLTLSAPLLEVLHYIQEQKTIPLNHNLMVIKYM